MPLEAAEQVAHRRHHDMLDGGVGDDLFQRSGEVLDDDDGFGAAVLELVFQFARRVQRIDVDHDVAGAQDRCDADRVLHDVGHHQCDATARGDAARLQPGAQAARGGVDLGIGDRLAHADEGGTRGVRLHRLFQHLGNGFVLIDVDFRRHTGGILLQPQLVHFQISSVFVACHYCICLACRQQWY
jgi:hypothetical protein